MNVFVKILETEDHGQLCVMKDTDDEDRPIIKIYCHPKGLGVCRGELVFNNCDEGFDRQEHAFKEITVTCAIGVCQMAFDMAKDI